VKTTGGCAGFYSLSHIRGGASPVTFALENDIVGSDRGRNLALEDEAIINTIGQKGLGGDVVFLWIELTAIPVDGFFESFFELGLCLEAE
jgi:hypothetical protein